MKLSFRLVFSIVLNLIYIGFTVWLIYGIFTRKYPWWFAIAVFVLLINLPRMLTAYRRYSTEDDSFTIDLSIHPVIHPDAGEKLIWELLEDDNVLQVIRNDLRKTHQIGYREEWRLGLITPGGDSIYNIRLARTAVLHSAEYFKSNNVVVTNGTIRPLGKNEWIYGLSTRLNQGEYFNLRKIEMEDDAGVAAHSRSFPGFLVENGFPLRADYPDGDPLTTDRGGTIVIDQGKLKVIYPSYFIQRRLIDDGGNLVELGIDEDLRQRSTFSVKLTPSMSKGLMERVSKNSYTPVLRYRSVPYTSDFLLPLVDTPLSASGWADLYLDSQGRGKLYIAREKSVQEWYELMDRLKALFVEEFARKGDRLLGLSKDRSHLLEYLGKKERILGEYFLIQEVIVGGL